MVVCKHLTNPKFFLSKIIVIILVLSERVMQKLWQLNQIYFSAVLEIFLKLPTVLQTESKINLLPALFIPPFEQ